MTKQMKLNILSLCTSKNVSDLNIGGIMAKRLLDQKCFEEKFYSKLVDKARFSYCGRTSNWFQGKDWFVQKWQNGELE